MITGDSSRMTPDMKANYAIVKAMGLEAPLAPSWAVQRAIVESIRNDEVVVDALLGTGFRGEVRSPTSELIDAVNAAAKRALVAIDVPSGLDCNTGAASNATIRADLTITFVASKTGFAVASAAPYLGRVEVADIGAPPELVAEILRGSMPD
jgi:NAD(P)H-hydrate epimerase